MNNADQTTLLAKHLVNSGHVNASSLSCPHAVRASAALTRAGPSIHRPPVPSYPPAPGSLVCTAVSFQTSGLIGCRRSRPAPMIPNTLLLGETSEGRRSPAPRSGANCGYNEALHFILPEEMIPSDLFQINVLGKSELQDVLMDLPAGGGTGKVGRIHPQTSTVKFNKNPRIGFRGCRARREPESPGPAFLRNSVIVKNSATS